MHRWNAKRRSIPFRFTFLEWIDWWGDDYVKRGRTGDALVMARRGDAGAYEAANVFKCAQKENIAQACGTPEGRQRASEQMSAYHVARKARGVKSHLERRDGHPAAHAVITPEGRFGSITLAAEHYGYSTKKMSRLLQADSANYRLLADNRYYVTSRAL